MESNELQHHGVKGMKWGVRKGERVLTRKYKKLGDTQGIADYYKEKSRQVGSSYDKEADALDKKAAIYKSQGSAVKAAKLTAKANKIRSDRKLATAEYDAAVEKYLNKEAVLRAKISDIKTKRSASLGKAKIDYILSKSRTKGYKDMVRLDAAERAAVYTSIGIDVARGVKDARDSYKRTHPENN